VYTGIVALQHFYRGGRFERAASRTVRLWSNLGAKAGSKTLGRMVYELMKNYLHLHAAPEAAACGRPAAPHCQAVRLDFAAIFD
jgi:hypothetical protein